MSGQPTADASADTPDSGNARAALLRLASRSARRSFTRSLLIVVLLAVPVATAVVVAAGQRAVVASPDEQRAWQFGQSDWVVNSWLPFAFGQPLTDQAVAELSRNYSMGDDDARIILEWAASMSPEAVSDAVTDAFVAAAGTTDGVEVVDRSQTSFRVGRQWTQVVQVDPTSPVIEGTVSLRSGAWPEGDGQTSITPELASRLDAGIGDTVDLGPAGAVVVTGIHVQRADAGALGALITPDATVSGLRAQHELLVRLPDGSGTAFQGADIETSLFRPYEDIGRHLADEVFETAPPGVRQTLDTEGLSIGAQPTETFFGYDTSTPLQLDRPPVLSGFVAAALLLEVALVAAAAFATGARRRLREFGLLATIGAEPSHIRRLVLVEAGVLGIIGATAGVILGVVTTNVLSGSIAGLASHVVDEVGTRPADLVAPGVVGVLAALGAAWFPARTASRVPVLSALAGRMPTRPLRSWTVPAAAGLLALGLFIVGAGAVAIRSNQYDASSSDGQIILMILGCLFCLAGAALGAGWVVGHLGSRADRMPLTSRLALRDAGRQQFRSSVGIAALVVVLAAPVMVVAVAVTAEADEQANHVASVADDEVLIQVDSLGTDTAFVFDPEALDPARNTMIERVDALTPLQTYGTIRFLDFGSGETVWARPVESFGPEDAYASGAAALGDAEAIRALRLSDAAASALASGRVVGLTAGSADGGVVIDRYDEATGTVDSTVFDAVSFDLRPSLYGTPTYLIPPDIAEQSGFQTQRTATLAVTVEPLTGPQRDALWQDLDWTLSDGRSIEGWIDVDNPFVPYADRVQAIALPIAAAVVLIIGGCLVAIAATESDRDVDTMVRVGAAPAMRRRFLGFQAGYHALLGALLGVPVGLLLLVSLRRALTNPPPLLLPWVTLGVVIVVIPLALALVIAGLVRSARTGARS